MAVIFRGSRNRKPETEFRQACMRWLKLRFGHHFYAAKQIGGIGVESGRPDTFCSIRGQFFAFEWKAPGGHGRRGPKQVEQIDAINAAGGHAFFIESFEDLESAVADIEPVQMGFARERSKSK
jgi:hypothetical protein